MVLGTIGKLVQGDLVINDTVELCASHQGPSILYKKTNGNNSFPNVFKKIDYWV